MDLRDAFTYYVDAKKANGRAERTIADYHRCIGPFLDWCERQGLQPAGLARQDIRAFVSNVLREQGWSEGTVAIYVRNLRAFLSWIYEEGLTAVDLASSIECPRQVKRVERVLTEAELLKLVQACEGRYAKRDQAIILTLADAGFRIGEMVKLTRGQVQVEHGKVWIQALQPKTLDARDWRFAVLGWAASDALIDYLESRGDDDPTLWMGHRGPLTGGGIRKALYRRARQAGLDPSRAHPHAFRKFFATSWIRNGGDEGRLMLAGGWASKEALEPYIDLARLQDIRQAHSQYGPVDKVYQTCAV